MKVHLTKIFNLYLKDEKMINRAHLKDTQKIKKFTYRFLNKKPFKI